ncbi:2-dehydropantoate 2-reductase [Rhizobium laguerreae]|uniref:ketopantoate reductase family protein n=1 Tax=Rhizobium laguerreae TaxID=1076926 RepID=UPI00103E573D|nr:2-dehydropantoate 2-reductase [Rhizobium laguerreae]MBY3279830.1 2-dehydropantoate 2-reductase [Rhizobium laguerreae]MBY3422453.1 2-dehydropantoate 2-reductase [Rhizobium laguerreae]MBY3473401.1 2-dehydropantoate 2-reductase [Rhizobium laguerreae]MBY3522885.1 2-dehydropantoate 2-reductase [Rhizobium laguerreae]MBY3569011.1 2-dehydropantoate 2-reductase [Rhizobium laguerreae]
MSKFEYAAAENRRVCIAGAGAIGLTLAARLATAGFDVSVVARGESLEAIKQNGIRLLDLEGDHSVKVRVGAANELGVQHILFLCPKSQDLGGLATSLLSMITAETVIVPVINGVPWWMFEGIGGGWDGRAIESVDPGGQIKSMLPPAQIIGTTAMITAERLRPGLARTRNPLHMTLGELDDRHTRRLAEIEGILNKSGIATRIAPRIRDAVWTKVARNMISNPVTAITGATLGQNFGSRYLADVSYQMLMEIIPVIEAYGSKLELDPSSIITSGRNLGDVRTSMLQDLEKGHRLELASICDAVLELAKLRNIQMPVTAAITALAHFLESGERIAAA